MAFNHKIISLTASSVAKSRAFSGIPYAQEIFATMKKMGGTGQSLKFEELAPSYEARYNLINKLLFKSNRKQILEIASGLAPPGIALS